MSNDESLVWDEYLDQVDNELFYTLQLDDLTATIWIQNTNPIVFDCTISTNEIDFILKQNVELKSLDEAKSWCIQTLIKLHKEYCIKLSKEILALERLIQQNAETTPNLTDLEYF
jgi:hypothetical protein